MNPDATTDTIGARISNLRKQRGLSLEDLANLSGSSKSYIWEIEHKGDASMSVAKLAAIAEALKVPVHYFLDACVALDDAEDARFFEQYKAMSVAEKRRMRRILAAMIDV